MHVISKKSLLFVQLAKDRKEGAPIIGKKTKKFHLNASPSPQEIPDWVIELDSYKRAKKAKVITEYKQVVEPVEEDEVETDEDNGEAEAEGDETAEAEGQGEGDESPEKPAGKKNKKKANSTAK